MGILVTGAAGFIGSTLAEQLLQSDEEVIGIDNFNDFYNPEFKRRNAKELEKYSNFHLIEIDFCDLEQLEKVFDKYKPEVVAHLGAMANVRYSVENPAIFSKVNVVGTDNLLSLAVQNKVKNFVYASTGSIYGRRKDVPFKESDQADAPLAAYPATKKAGELLGHAYHNTHGLSFTALRFFNVYGPRGRPDMMPFRVTEAILNDIEIPIFGEGLLERDWTYVGDLVSGFIAAINKPHSYEIINLGRGKPVVLNDFMSTMETVVGKPAKIKFVPTPASEPPVTFADITKAQDLLSYQPKVDLKEGLENFWAWYQQCKAS